MMKLGASASSSCSSASEAEDDDFSSEPADTTHIITHRLDECWNSRTAITIIMIMMTCAAIHK